MYYTQASIDRVRDADIVQTINNFETLKKEGANYKCTSPFKSEKTPSFVVSPVKQMFKCFATGFGGDGIKFVMQKKNIDFIEAIEVIAQIHNIYLEKEEVTPEQQRVNDQKGEMYSLLDKVTKQYVSNRKKLEPSHWCDIMIKERAFTKDTLVDYQIGYAELNNALTKWSIETGTLSIAKDLGLSNSKDSASYDVFKDRLIFPIHNHKGTIIGFGGRRNNSEASSKYPKYVNSKESPVYNKSNVLYGLFQAKKHIAKTGTAILTEGYTDVIAMVQNNLEHTVASCGTALTDAHAKLLKLYAKEIILLRDGDSAGLQATIRDIDVCLANGLQVSLCILPEGDDPDTLANRLKEKTADWINDNKQDAVLWKVANYDVKSDKYDSDVQAIKDLEQQHITAILQEISDDVLLGELEGEALKAAKAKNTELRNEIKGLKKQTKLDIKDLPEIDPHKKATGVDDICKTLFNIKHETKRDTYIKQIAVLFNVPAGNIKKQIGELEKQDTETRKNKIGVHNTENLRLPKGADKEEYLQHGFVTVGNSYYFQSNNGGFFQGTQFKLNPLFHILGDKENKRVCEIVNVSHKKQMIDFDSSLLASFFEFKKYLFRLGGYRFFTHNGVQAKHFDEFVNRFDDEFEPALELLTLGWNSKGFYAFADGVYYNGKFRAVNKYGIIHLKGIDTKKKEYNQNVENYYSPAFSAMYKDNQEGDDRYENDRYFVYKESPVSLDEWMQQMITVFAEKGLGGILFNFASCFRDLFLSHYDYFPLMGGFGEKDSGKSGFGKILQNFFYYRLPALDLTQATHVGFSRRLSRNYNTIQFLDEYQDKITDDKIFSGMMGAWNGIGREKGMNSGDKRTQYDKINSAIYYAGQFMPTRMENALATRTISWLFQSRNYSSEEKSEFNKLLNWTNEGLSSLVVDVVQHRTYFEKNLPVVHSESVRTLKEALKDQDYQERIFGNVAMLLTTFRLLEDQINFPFTDNEVITLLKKLIIDNSEQISDSNGLTEFWSVITFLFERGHIQVEREFKIKKKLSFKITENRQKIEYKNVDRKNILFLRLKTVYQDYNKEVSKREGVDVIGQTTLRQYFKSRDYFIGLVGAERFGKASGESCYAFDYDAMVKLGLVNLLEDDSIQYPDQDSSKENQKETLTPETLKEDDGLDF
ncbi:DNA primase [Psychroserpens burtonensis]|uniref:DNA primase n=1 Tax=Psychroserpens burtonensis TaxID=49278 RepID=A0A5C7BA55_9FLAO|nr:DNA primase [Psychroserpens burtonensis]TXE18594.1 DNA primase [Psychroserpens burtonensis]